MKKKRKLFWSTKDASGNPLERGILRRSDGKKFRARIVRITDGKPKQYVRNADNITEAKRLKKVLEDDHRQGGKEKLDAYHVTFEQLAKEYRDRKLTPPAYDNPESDNRKKRKGRVSYKDCGKALDLFVEYFGKKLIRTITWEDLDEWKTARLDVPKVCGGKRPFSFYPPQKRSFLSVNRELEVLRACFRFAVKKKPQPYLTSSPFDADESLITDETGTERDRVLGHDEEDRLMGALADDLSMPNRVREAREYLKMFLTFLLYTAARCNEARQVERRDINLDTGVITLRSRTTKTQKKREIPIMHGRLREVIEQRLATISDAPNAPVFGNVDVKKSFREAKKRANIQDFKLHDARHTAVTRWIAAGMSATVAMKYSGHTQMKTFLRYLNNEATINEHSVQLMESYMAAHQIQQPMQSAHIN